MLVNGFFLTSAVAMIAPCKFVILLYFDFIAFYLHLLMSTLIAAREGPSSTRTLSSNPGANAPELLTTPHPFSGKKVHP